MATQKININSFYGGMANVLAPHLLGTSVARTSDDYMVDNGTLHKVGTIKTNQLVPASANPQLYNHGDVISLVNSENKQKPVFFQGNPYILNNGIPVQLRGANKISTIVGKGNLSAITISGQSSGDNNNYYVSYKNTAGFESPLVHIGEVKGYTITLGSVPTLANHKVQLYRIGARELNYALISKDLKDGSLTKQFGDNVAASPSKSNPPAKFTHLQAHRLGLMASADNILYLSALRPDAWDTFSSLNLSGTITGIASIDRGALIFTENHYVYSLVGTSITNIKLDIVNQEIGCDDHNSICRLRDGSVVWVFENDVYKYNGRFDNITRGKFKLTYYGNAVAFMNRYILLSAEGILTIDLGIPAIPIISYNFNVGDKIALQIVHKPGEKPSLAYVKDDNSIHTLQLSQPSYTRFGLGGFGGDSGTVDESTETRVGKYPTGVTPNIYAEIGDIGSVPQSGVNSVTEFEADHGTYHSGDFYAQTYDSESTFNSIDLVHRGKVVVYLYVDNELVSTQTVERVSKGVSRVMYPASSNRGAYTSVKLEFSEEVYNYSISVEATPIK